MPRIRSWRDITNATGFRSALRGGMLYLFGRRGQRRVRGLRLYYRLRVSVLLRTGETVARLARRNDVRLWVDGASVFRRLDRLIRRAQHSIIIQMFIWKNDETGRRIARALLEAADRGVQVDITKEAVGDFFEFRGDFLGTKGSAAEPWNRFWNHPRIRIAYASHNDHAKVFVIDGHTLLLSGMNIADEYRYQWHDYMVELRGASFVEQFLTRSPMPEDPDPAIRLVMNTEEHKEIRPVLMQLLQSARDHVAMEQSYLSDGEIVDTLIALSHRNIQVTVVLPNRTDFHHHANMAAIGRLVSEGKAPYLTVLIYPRMSHAKATIVDHKTVFIGSANAFRASLDEMGEVNVLVRGRSRIVWRLRESMRSSILHSKAVNGPPPLVWLSRWLALLGL